MRNIFLIITCVLSITSAKAQQPEDRVWEIRAGYSFENFYDRSHADTRLSSSGYSVMGGFKWGRENIHSLWAAYSHIPQFNFRGIELGRSMHTFFGYDFLRGKPFLRLSGIEFRYGAHLGGTTTYRDFDILVNNRIVSMISFQIAPSLQICYPMKRGVAPRFTYNIKLPIASYTMINAQGDSQNLTLRFISFGKRTFIDSDFSATIKLGNIPFKAGYRWFFETLNLEHIESVYGSHNFYISIIL